MNEEYHDFEEGQSDDDLDTFLDSLVMTEFAGHISVILRHIKEQKDIAKYAGKMFISNQILKALESEVLLDQRLHQAEEDGTIDNETVPGEREFTVRSEIYSDFESSLLVSLHDSEIVSDAISSQIGVLNSLYIAQLLNEFDFYANTMLSEFLTHYLVTDISKADSLMDSLKISKSKQTVIKDHSSQENFSGLQDVLFDLRRSWRFENVVMNLLQQLEIDLIDLEDKTKCKDIHYIFSRNLKTIMDRKDFRNSVTHWGGLGFRWNSHKSEERKFSELNYGQVKEKEFGEFTSAFQAVISEIDSAAITLFPHSATLDRVEQFRKTASWLDCLDKNADSFTDSARSYADRAKYESTKRQIHTLSRMLDS